MLAEQQVLLAPLVTDDIRTLLHILNMPIWTDFCCECWGFVPTPGTDSVLVYQGPQTLA